MAIPENEHLAAMRVEYGSVEKDGSPDLDADWLAEGWVALLRKWLADAESAGIAEPNAMVVGTVDAEGRPVDPLGVVQERGRHRHHLLHQLRLRQGRGTRRDAVCVGDVPVVSLGRQVHLRGPVTKVAAEVTADYWRHRPRGSQLGAWASHQSRPIASREALLDQLADVTQRFADLDEVPVPPNWGGYLIAPDVVEFWQGRENRVHNRIRITEGRQRAASTVVRRLFADLTPLRTRDFRRLWVAGIPTVIGGNLTIFAVPVQLYALTQNSAYVGLSGIFALVPLVVFGLWGGALADHMDRRVLLIITSCGLAVASVFCGCRPHWRSTTCGWCCACCRCSRRSTRSTAHPVGGDPSDAAGRPTARGQLAEHDGHAVRRHRRAAARRGHVALGRSVDAVPDRCDHLPAADLGDASACADPADQRRRARPARGFRAVLDGFRYLAGNTVVLMSFVVDLIAMILGMPRALFPQMAHESFGGPVEGGTTMALLAAAIAVGAVAGGVFSGWLPRIQRQGFAVIVAILVWGVAMIGFGVASGLADGTAGPMFWIALVFLAVGGAADMVSSAFRNTILQQAASDDVRGRLQGVFTVVVAGGPRLADAVHGAAAATVGTTIAAAGGGGLVVVGVLIAAVLAPAFVRYRVNRPGPASRSGPANIRRTTTKSDAGRLRSPTLSLATINDRVSILSCLVIRGSRRRLACANVKNSAPAPR